MNESLDKAFKNMSKERYETYLKYKEMESQLRKQVDKNLTQTMEFKEMMKKQTPKDSDDELSDYELTEKDLYPSEAKQRKK